MRMYLPRVFATAETLPFLRDSHSKPEPVNADKTPEFTI